MSRRFAKVRAPEPTRRASPVAMALCVGIVLGIGGTLGVQRVLAPPIPAPGTDPGPGDAAAEAQVRSVPAFEFYDLLQRDPVVVPEPDPGPGAGRRRETPAPTERAPWLLQAGSFRAPEDADRRRAEILLLGLSAFTRRVRTDDGAVWHRVLVGPFDDAGALRDAKTRLGTARIETLVLRPAA